MEITRKYAHKRFGELATVTLTVPTEGWILNGVALTERSVQHLANFCLQSLQDAYAASQSEDEALAAFEKKLEKILGGTIGIRTSGPRDPVRTMAIRLAELGMTGPTAKVRTEKAIALVDSTSPNGYWWEMARDTIERAKGVEEASPEVAEAV